MPEAAYTDRQVRPPLPRFTIERRTSASAIDWSQMTGRSLVIVWLGWQLEIGLTRRDR